MLEVGGSTPVIHLYFANPNDWSDADLARDGRLLDASERASAGRLYFEHDRRLYTVAHAMLRRALAVHVAEPPERLRFTCTARGKPLLQSSSVSRAPRFSLSHSRGITACAVSAEHEVGIDVEHAERPMPIGIAERWFAPAERAALEALSTAERAPAFFAYWTLKEAYAKARGLGLALPFDRIAFRFTSRGVVFEPDESLGETTADWQFLSFLLPFAHPTALAVRSPTPCSVRFNAMGPDRDEIPGPLG